MDNIAQKLSEVTQQYGINSDHLSSGNIAYISDDPQKISGFLESFLQRAFELPETVELWHATTKKELIQVLLEIERVLAERVDKLRADNTENWEEYRAKGNNDKYIYVVVRNATNIFLDTDDLSLLSYLNRSGRAYGINFISAQPLAYESNTARTLRNHAQNT